jgi:multicomponent Na+:H+ antiporter subunit C
MVLISNAANLFIMSAGLSKGREPIYPLPAGRSISDPLVQSMTLTAIVISFGVSALLLAIVYRVYQAHRSIDIETLAEAEEQLAEEEGQGTPAMVDAMASAGVEE